MSFISSSLKKNYLITIMPEALVLLAEGAEEMEVVITVDVLRRAKIVVTVAGVAGKEPVKCSRGVEIVPDCSLNDVGSKMFDVVICPGGMGGAKTLSSSEHVGKLLSDQESKDGWIAAICAGPLALVSHNIGKGKTVTSHPGVKAQMCESGQWKYSEERVQKDGKIITSRGPGTAFEFALAIAEVLVGKDISDSLIPPMLLPTS